MGITAFDIKLLERTLHIYQPDIENVVELGSQNLYLSGDDTKPPFASTWYRSRGLIYCCIDLARDNNAYPEDLSEPISEKFHNEYMLLTDFGTSEHVVQMEDYEICSFHEGHINSIYASKIKSVLDGYYNCWLNKHKMLRKGGIMINVNPKTGNWPGHGYSYLTEKFYKQLAEHTDYEIIELGQHPASGNFTDGWNIHAILRKHSEKFPDFETFKKFDIRKS